MIPIFNASEEDITVEVPGLQLEEWKPEWDEENENGVNGFYLKGDRIKRNEEFDHEIEIKADTKPVKLKQFRIPFALKSEMERNIKEMKDADLIEESNTPWNLHTFSVPKKRDKDGKITYRIVTDMRKLNDLIEQDTFPLPIIDEILGELGNSRYFNVLDFWKEFFQIGLNSRKYTGFSANGKNISLQIHANGIKKCARMVFKNDDKNVGKSN